jgi:hypothetical protein
MSTGRQIVRVLKQSTGSFIVLKPCKGFDALTKGEKPADKQANKRY